ncbi:AraC-like DNA-binding protein [Flavobacterium sp. 270]|uniref:AraC family transcriptional regulator n=1 Tax=Flavobacterium sp. 270 TaxID=2512114 RepID=UPI0010661172|nr:AraC family transcriptional regulator [Flavobacterium sp. 270]TDW51832.1 AraC-like DNA-binding protein [Flavobacterium sp. 270]
MREICTIQIEVIMKAAVPIIKLNESILGVKIERINDEYINSRRKDVARSHRNEFYICILLDKGKVNFVIDFKEVTLNANGLVIFAPGQVLRVVEPYNIEGWVLYFDSKLVDDFSRSILEESLYQGPLLNLSQEQKKWFFQLMELLYDTSELNDMSAFYKPTMRAIVIPFIYRITAMYQASIEQNKEQHSLRSNAIVTSFRKLLRQNYKEIKSPQEYANMMNLSLGYLNDTLKHLTGNTVSHSIQEEAMREAQRLLWYSELSIKEIASAIGFEDPKYFSRIFSKLTNKSPAQFRNSYQGDQ